MRFIDISTNQGGQSFLLRHGVERGDVKRGSPLYTVYYRERNGGLCSSTLSIYDLARFVSNHCTFSSQADITDFGLWLSSLKGIPNPSDNFCIRWRVR